MNFTRGFGIGSKPAGAGLTAEQQREIQDQANEAKRKDPQVAKLVSRQLRVWHRDVALGKQVLQCLRAAPGGSSYPQVLWGQCYSVQLLASSPRLVAATQVAARGMGSPTTVDALVVQVLMGLKEQIAKQPELFAEFGVAERPWKAKQRAERGPRSSRIVRADHQALAKPLSHSVLFVNAVAHVVRACAQLQLGTGGTGCGFAFGDTLRTNAKVVMAGLQILFTYSSPSKLSAVLPSGVSGGVESWVASALSRACQSPSSRRGATSSSTSLFGLLRRKLTSTTAGSPVIVKTLMATMLQVVDFFGNLKPGAANSQNQQQLVLASFTAEYLGNVKLQQDQVSTIVGKLNQTFSVRWFSLLAAMWSDVFFPPDSTAAAAGGVTSTQQMAAHTACANVLWIGYTYLQQCLKTEAGGTEESSPPTTGNGSNVGPATSGGAGNGSFAETFRKLWLQVIRTGMAGSGHSTSSSSQFNHLVRVLKEATPDARWLQDRFSVLWSTEGFPLVFESIMSTQKAATAAEKGKMEDKPKKKKGFFAELREKKPSAAEVAQQQILATASYLAVFEEPDWLPVAHLMLHLMQGASSTVALTLLSRAPDTLPPLWTYCRCLLHFFLAAIQRPNPNQPQPQVAGGAQAGQNPGGVGVIPVKVLVTAHVALALFTSLFSLFMTVLDDYEFVTLEVPFPLTTIKEIVEWCNRLLYSWNVGAHALGVLASSKSGSATTASSTTGASPQAAAAYLTDSLSRDELQLRMHSRSILRLLIDRNLRTPFTVPGLMGTGTVAVASAAVLKNSHQRQLELEAERYWYHEHQVDTSLFPAKGVPPSAAAMRLMFEMPHVVPFTNRVTYLHSFITADRNRCAMDKVKYGIKIRRTHAIADGYDQIMKVPVADAPLLRARLHVTYIDSFGQEEPGIDAGGVFKEFMEQLLNQAFHPQFGLFTCVEGSNELYPNAHAMSLFASEQDCLDHYRFLGRVLGKAIYESCVVPLYFAPFFINNLLGRGNSLDDLRKLDEQQYRSLMQLKELDDVEDAYVFFCMEEQFLGNTITTELCEGGTDTQVTNENVVRYMHTVAYHKMTLSTKAHTRAFREGLLDLLDKAWLSLFDANEFQQLISGGKSNDKLDIAELRKHTKLVGGYNDGDRTLSLLFEVLDEMSVADQGKFLQFVTGSSRPPLLGFAAMNPPFSIRRTDTKSNLNLIVDIDRLPTAATCFNLLKLPPYMNKTNLKEKLLTSIRSGAGFDLS